MDDLISRQAAIDAVLKDPIGRMLAEKYNLIGFLEELPSAQPQNGKWIKTDRWDEVCDTLCECSECHSFVLVEEDYKYCPYCGADMRGEQDD